MKHLLEGRIWALAAIFQVVLALYLFLFFAFGSALHPQQGLAWIWNYRTVLEGIAGVYFFLGTLAVFSRHAAVNGCLFAAGSFLAAAAAGDGNALLLPALLAPALAGGFLRSQFHLAFIAELTAQFMVLAALVLSGFQNNGTVGLTPFLGFAGAAVFVNASSFFMASAVRQLLIEIRRTKGVLNLMRVSSEMGALRNYDKISGLLTAVVRAMFDADHFGFYVVEETEDGKRSAVPRWIESSHANVFLPFDLEVAESVMAEVVRTGKPRVVEDFRRQNDRMLSPLPFFRSGLFHPIAFEGEILGLIFLISPVPGSYDAEQVGLLELLSNQVAVTLKNISLYQKTATMAVTDSLTNLYTHGYFQDQLAKMIRDHKYLEKPLGLVIFDVDHFKQINDTYGHPQGDYVLRQLAGLVKGMCRKEDVISRYGGDEFVLILPATDRMSACAFAERVRAAVQEFPFVSGHQVLNITISAGVSTVPDRLTSKELVDAADEALYEAKKRGRNQIFYV